MLTFPFRKLARLAFEIAEFEFDVQWMDWRDFESLTVNFADGSTTSAPYNWQDTFTLRLGAEYGLNEMLSLRGGYAFDPTPYPDETLGFAPPDADRHNVYLGGQYRMDNGFFADLALLYGLPVSNTTADEPFMPQVKGTFDITFSISQRLADILTISGTE